MTTRLIARRSGIYPTQRAMAQALGLTAPAYCDIERGKVLPTVAVLARMCFLLGCGPLDLYEPYDIDLIGCGKEDSMSITHETRRESYHTLNPEPRYRQITQAFKQRGSMTALECMRFLGYTDPNSVRPRITELERRGVLEETGEKSRDAKTKKLGTVYRLKEDKP